MAFNVLIITISVLSGFSVLLISTLLFRRAQLTNRAKFRRTTERQLKPYVLELLDGNSEAFLGLKLRRKQLVVLAELLTKYGRTLVGQSREQIIKYFEAQGFIDGQLEELTGKKYWRRAKAAYLLGDVGSQRVVEPLTRVVNEDIHNDVATAAARSLGKLKATESIPDIIAASVRGTVPRFIAAQAVLDIGLDAEQTLTQLLKDSDAQARATAAELIGLAGSATDAKELEKLLEDSDPKVRSAAAFALEKVGGPNSATQLLQKLSDPEPDVQSAVAKSLGSLGDGQAVEKLLVIAEGDNFESAQAATNALIKLDPSTVIKAVEAGTNNPHLIEAHDLLEAGIAT